MRESLAFFAQFAAEMPPVRPSSLQHSSQTYRRGTSRARRSNLPRRGQPGTGARDAGPTRHFKRLQRGTDATLFRLFAGFSRGCPRYGHDLARGAPPVKAAKCVPVRFFRPLPALKQPALRGASSGPIGGWSPIRGLAIDPHPAWPRQADLPLSGGGKVRALKQTRIPALYWRYRASRYLSAGRPTRVSLCAPPLRYLSAVYLRYRFAT